MYFNHSVNTREVFGRPRLNTDIKHKKTSDAFIANQYITGQIGIVSNTARGDNVDLRVHQQPTLVETHETI